MATNQTGALHSDLPFAEWSDALLNKEQWEAAKDYPKNKMTKKIGGQDEVSYNYFHDEQVLVMPVNLVVRKWVKIKDVFPNDELVVYKTQDNYYDLKTSNEHILSNKFVRRFANVIKLLEYMGSYCPWNMEGTTTDYVPSTTNNPWKPWHHVYSSCKAGKGQTHNPKYNNFGKYVVRLFWLGCWRMIIVDDLIPLNSNNDILLPSTFIPSAEGCNNSRRIIEIWPFVLAKALLKVTSIMHCETVDNYDEIMLHSITGWHVLEKINMSEISFEDLWSIMKAYSVNYVWPEDRIKISKGDGQKKKARDKSADSKRDKGTKSSKKDKGSSKGSKSKKGENNVDEEDDTSPYHCILRSVDLRSNTDNRLSDLAPSWDLNLLCAETRDVPLNKPPETEPLASWKRFRWLDWAVERELLPNPNADAITELKLVCGMSKLNVCDTVYVPPTRKIDSANKKSAKDGKKSAKDAKKSASDKQSKSSKKGDAGKNKTKFVPLPDISFWINAQHLYDHLQYLLVVMKKSKFCTRTRITNVESKKPIIDKKKETKGANSRDIVYNADTYGNRPIYFFSDSIYASSLYVFVSLIGEVSLLRKLDTFASPENMKNDRTCNVRMCPFHCPDLDDDIEITPMTALIDNRCKYAMTDCDWHTTAVRETLMIDEVREMSGHVINIPRGRNIGKLYVDGNVPYVMDVLSDLNVVIGDEELLLGQMTRVPELLIEYCRHVAHAFGTLIRQFGDRSEYAIAMRAFTKALTNDVDFAKSQRRTVLKSFCDELSHELQKVHANEDVYPILFALKVLFLDPSLRCILNPRRMSDCVDQTKRELELCQCGVSSSDTELNIKTNEMSAVVLQAQVRNFLVRNLLRYHDEKNVKHLTIVGALKKIYDEVFSVTNRYVVLKRIVLRLFHTNRAMRPLNAMYPFFKDLRNYLQCETLSGTLNVTIDEWYAIVRFTVRSLHDQPFRLLIRFYADAEFNYAIKITDNATCIDQDLLMDGMTCYTLKPNAKGYTVLVCGHAMLTCKLDWRLCLCHVKMGDVPSIEIDRSQALISKKIVYTYVPNCYEYICRCLIKIKEDVSLTVHLQLSANDVTFLLRLTREDGQIYKEELYTDTVVLPVIDLHRIAKDAESNCSVENVDRREEDDYTVYHLTAEIMFSNWPLSFEEWRVVDAYKYSILLKPITESFIEIKPEDFNITAAHLNEVPQPYWMLEVLHDKPNALILENDITKLIELNELKKSWYEESLDRYIKGYELRDGYLFKHSREPIMDDPLAMQRSAKTVSRKNDDVVGESSPQIDVECINAISLDQSNIYVKTRENEMFVVKRDSKPIYLEQPKLNEVSSLNLTQYYGAQLDNSAKAILYGDDFIRQCNEAKEQAAVIYDDIVTNNYENFESITDDRISKMDFLHDWYREVFDGSDALLTSAHKYRENFMQKLKEESLGTKGAEKKGKSKAEKKKSKKK